jgi:hypothetical protein
MDVHLQRAPKILVGNGFIIKHVIETSSVTSIGPGILDAKRISQQAETRNG